MSTWRNHVKKTYKQMKRKDKSTSLGDAMKKAATTWKSMKSMFESKNKTRKAKKSKR